jgi:hypothetical protein
MWFWIILGILVGMLLVGAWFWDRRHDLDDMKVRERRPDGWQPLGPGDGGGG